MPKTYPFKKSLLSWPEDRPGRIFALLNNRIIALIKRELRKKLMTKSYIIMTVSVPLFMLLIFGLQMLIMLYQGDKGTRIELITQSESLTDRCRKYLTKLDFIKEG